MLINQRRSFIYNINSNLSNNNVNRNFRNNADIDGIISMIRSLTPCEAKILRIFMELSGSECSNLIRVANEWIAVKAGCTIKTVTRSLKSLIQNNILRRWNFGGPRQYVLADNFQDSCLSEYVHETILGVIYIRESGCVMESDSQNEMKSVATDFDTRSATQKIPQEDAALKEIDSHISPFVEQITLVPLSFGEKYRLSQYATPVIAKALRVIAKYPEEKRTFSYLNGICKKRAGNEVTGGSHYKNKYRIESDGSGNTHAIDLEQERLDKGWEELNVGRKFMENFTSGSDFYDATQRERLGLDISPELKASAAQEVENLGKYSTNVSEWIEHYGEECHWQSVGPHPEPIRNEAWEKASRSYRDAKDIDSMIQIHSQEEFFDESDDMIFDSEILLYESELDQNHHMVFELDHFTEDDGNTMMQDDYEE
jgi:hypothetical protein